MPSKPPPSSWAASISPPVHSSLRKRQASDEASEISNLAPSKKVRAKKQLNGDHATPAFDIPHQFEAVYEPKPERSLTPEFEQIDNQADDEQPNSSQTARPANYSRSPSHKRNAERDSSPDGSDPAEAASGSPAASPEPESKPEDIWNIDGLDIRAVVAKDPTNKTKFSRNQGNKILLWMKVNETRGLTGHTESFKQLLGDLGFSGKGHTKEVEDALRTKVKGRIHTWYGILKKKGIVVDVEAEENGKGADALKVKFADYTDGWLKEGWNGNITVPAAGYLNTIEVDKESFSDEEPETFVVENTPSKKARSATKQKNGGPSFEVLAPPMDLYSAIHDYYMGAIRKAKEEDDAKKPVGILEKKTLNKEQWNVAAVQAQHAAIPVNATLQKEEIEDSDMFDPNFISENGSNEEEEEEEGVDHSGMTPVHQYASIDNQKSPCQRGHTIIDPNALYAKVDSEHSTPIKPSVEKPTSPSHNNTTPPPSDDIANQTERSPSNESFDSISSLTSAIHPDLVHFDTPSDEDEIMSDSSHFGDEEDNSNASSDSRSVTPADSLLEYLPGSGHIHCKTCLYPLVSYEVMEITHGKYWDWKTQLQAILMVHGTWKILTGEMKAPVPFIVDASPNTGKGFFGGDDEFEIRRKEFEKERREWEQKVDSVWGWMLLTMELEMRRRVARWGVEEGDVLGLWAKFSRQYESPEDEERVGSPMQSEREVEHESEWDSEEEMHIKDEPEW